MAGTTERVYSDRSRGPKFDSSNPEPQTGIQEKDAKYTGPGKMMQSSSDDDGGEEGGYCKAHKEYASHSLLSVIDAGEEAMRNLTDFLSRLFSQESLIKMEKNAEYTRPGKVTLPFSDDDAREAQREHYSYFPFSVIDDGDKVVRNLTDILSRLFCQESLIEMDLAKALIQHKSRLQMVSNHLLCPDGYDGAPAQEGLGRKCCWDNPADGDLFCYIVDMKKGGGGDTGDAPVHRPAGEYCQH